MSLTTLLVYYSLFNVCFSQEGDDTPSGGGGKDGIYFISNYLTNGGAGSDISSNDNDVRDVTGKKINDNDIPFYETHTSGIDGALNTIKKNQQYIDYIENASDSFTFISCSNYKDYYTLVYNICQHEKLCSEAYYIESAISLKTPGEPSSSSSIASVKERNDFKKFFYQLSLSRVFPIQDLNLYTTNESSSGGGGDSGNQSYTENQQTMGQSNIFFFENNWPMEWVPPYIIQLNHTDNSTTKCHNSIDLYDRSNAQFIRDTLHMLLLYKTYVVSEYHCEHFNQRLVLDTNNNPHCECKSGKSCSGNNNFQTIIIVLEVVFILLFIVWIISMFFNARDVIKKIDDTNKRKRALPTTTTTITSNIKK